MRFLFTTLQYVESDFYGRVGARLAGLGHDAAHLTWSRRAAGRLRRNGTRAHAMPDLMRELGRIDVERQARRLEAQLPIGSLREVWRTDWPCRGRPEDWCLERTVRQFMAIERLLDAERPDAIVPEVGSETMRTAAHLTGLAREIPVLFLFYTIFPRPLRLFVDDMAAPIAAPEELRELSAEERAEVERFILAFAGRAEPIRPHREPPLRLSRARAFARHVAVRAIWDRDNDYLRPGRWLRQQAAEPVRTRLARPLYRDPAERPSVYFPLHVADDYKIARLVPHLADQASIVEQLASALPRGHDLIVKEHPMSIGRNPLGFLRRVSGIPNVRLVDPHTSSHELIERSRAVVVIGSTVGLEALLYGKPVLTLGRPFYAGAGVTFDIDSLRDLRDALPALFAWRPERDLVLRFLHAAMRRCRDGVPALVDASDANAAAVAGSLSEAAQAERSKRRVAPAHVG
jgi:Capsule polysaccharide biosynthesis protein